LQEIGDHLGVTRERVRQIESRAKEKLRRSRQAHSLRGYLN
jgi:DNA-directed RNA polymerase sigma subunit (sigma70/sigma32)